MVVRQRRFRPGQAYDSTALRADVARVGVNHCMPMKALYQDIPVAVISHMAGHISGDAIWRIELPIRLFRCKEAAIRAFMCLL